MEECVDKGLVRSIGVSNFSPEKIEAFFSDAKIFPAVNQVCCTCRIWHSSQAVVS